MSHSFLDYRAQGYAETHKHEIIFQIGGWVYFLTAKSHVSAVEMTDLGDGAFLRGRLTHRAMRECCICHENLGWTEKTGYTPGSITHTYCPRDAALATGRQG